MINNENSRLTVLRRDWTMSSCAYSPSRVVEWIAAGVFLLSAGGCGFFETDPFSLQYQDPDTPDAKGTRGVDTSSDDSSRADATPDVRDTSEADLEVGDTLADVRDTDTNEDVRDDTAMDVDTDVGDAADGGEDADVGDAADGGEGADVGNAADGGEDTSDGSSGADATPDVRDTSEAGLEVRDTLADVQDMDTSEDVRDDTAMDVGGDVGDVADGGGDADVGDAADGGDDAEARDVADGGDDADARDSTGGPWVKQIGPSNHFKTSNSCSKQVGIRSVTTDNNGNVYVTGGIREKWANTQPRGKSDAFVAKYDRRGKRMWAKRLGVSGGKQDVGHDIAVDSTNDKVYIAGVADGGNNSFPHRDGFIVKMDTSSGQTKWTKRVSNQGWDGLWEITIETNSSGKNHVYAAGDTENDSSASKVDAVLVKYDEDGNRHWTKKVGSDNRWDAARDVAIDNAGHVYMVGFVRGNDLPNATGGGIQDGFIASYESDGSPRWKKVPKATTSSQDDIFSSVEVIQSKSKAHIYVSGYRDKSSRNPFVAKFDTSGAFKKKHEVKKADNRGILRLHHASQNGNPTIYAVLSTTNSISGQGSGKRDGFVLKYDTGLNPPTLAHHVGTPEKDRILGIASHNTRTYVPGWTCGKLGSRQSMNAPDGFVKGF